MHASDMLLLFNHAYWANDKILTIAAKLPPEQLAAPAVSFDTILGTLTHMFNAEWVWRTRLQERQSPTEMYFRDSAESLAALTAVWREEQQTMLTYVTGLSDAQLEEQVAYRTLSGVPYENKVWHVLMQLIQHGGQHRAELAAQFTALGHSPGNMDLIIYLGRL